MKHKQRLIRLQKGVRSILAKSGYAFSKEDKALLEAILLELEEISNDEKDHDDPNQMLQILSLLLRFLKFFGIDDITELF